MGEGSIAGLGMRAFGLITVNMTSKHYIPAIQLIIQLTSGKQYNIK